MADSVHGIPQQGGRIRRLPIDAVNRIAAGEVIERPAAVVKELVENALDAGATTIRVRIERGGMGRILVEDNGWGMSPEDLALAFERHATSKLTVAADGGVDLLDIRTMGFRGEALPSIGSVARVLATSRATGSGHAVEVSVEGGALSGPRPAAWGSASDTGTRIDVRDLFFATPARLAFMKSERAEAMAVGETLRRIALARPYVAFQLESEERTALRLTAETGSATEARLAREATILGREFRDNAMEIAAERDGVRVSGHAGLPTFNRGGAQHQYLFVNGRPVKDRLLTGVIRAAYQDFLARDRHPVAVLHVDLDPHLVDVNVHPAKTEVRFRDPANVRGLMIGALRHALAAAGHRASTTVAGMALGAMRPEAENDRQIGLPWTSASRPSVYPVMPSNSTRAFASLSEPVARDFEGERAEGPTGGAEREAPDVPQGMSEAFPLGRARTQVHETYVISETPDGILIVDQHAAHERLVYERMKADLAGAGVRRQALLIPEIVELGEDEAARVVSRSAELMELGLEIESFGRGAVAVRATPALFGLMDVAGLLKDLADDFAEYDTHLSLRERFEEVMGNMACRSSVRAGRRLSQPEMDALLRQMEATPHSGQCNHGRPTYVELKLADIERLFGRR